MIKSFPFNAIYDSNGVPDRAYLAEDFARYFAKFIGTGVYPNPATGLQVVAVDNNMQIRIKKGDAYILGRDFENTDDYIIQLDVADGVLSRIDRVALRLDYLKRDIIPVLKKGNYASSPIAPALQRDADAYEIALADVYVKNGVIKINQSDITDTRLNSELCGIVHAIIQQVDTTEIFRQFQAWFNEQKNVHEGDFEKWLNEFKIITGKKFEDWVEDLKNSLDPNEDIAAQLQMQISTIKSDLADIVTDNKRLTNSKDITGAINELFINANNGKQNWVDVIGSPLNIEDTFSTLKNKTQNLKNSMAEKLTTKGQDSKGIEDLQVLINKIDMLNSYDIDMLFLKYGNIFNNLTSTNTSFLGINLKSKRIISKHTIEEKFNILDFQGNVLQTFIIPQEIGVPVYYDPRNDLLLCQLNYNYNDRITIIDINNNIVSKYVFASRYETAIMYFIDSDKYIYIVTRLHDNVQGYPELRLYKLKSDGTQIATLRIDNSIDTGRIDKDNSYIKERENDIIARVMWLYSDGCIILKTNKELNRYNKVHIPGNLNINIVAETLLI
uniref:phage tail protein n=1 Tax=Clostridium sporogenes TaxID=1509 RepID=UPI001FAE3F11|nr:phage tail protein [Clostridium sporogenes]